MASVFTKPDTNTREVCEDCWVILKKPKDKFNQELLTGFVYKINCKDCEKVYIGQTSWALISRTKEHKRAVFTGDKNSLLAQHCMQNNHKFIFDVVPSGLADCFWKRGILFVKQIILMNTYAYTFQTFTLYKSLANP